MNKRRDLRAPVPVFWLISFVFIFPVSRLWAEASPALAEKERSRYELTIQLLEKEKQDLQFSIQELKKRLKRIKRETDADWKKKYDAALEKLNGMLEEKDLSMRGLEKEKVEWEEECGILRGDLDKTSAQLENAQKELTYLRESQQKLIDTLNREKVEKDQMREEFEARLSAPAENSSNSSTGKTAAGKGGDLSVDTAAEQKTDAPQATETIVSTDTDAKENFPAPEEQTGGEEAGTENQMVKNGDGDALEYRIGVGDVLFVHVWQEDDLSREVTVRPDGKISFPLAGDVSAKGLTFSQLTERLKENLLTYIRQPVVSITLQKIGGKKVIVLGEVESPGVYSVSGKKTLLEAVALAGGFTPNSVPSSTILIKGGLSKPKAERVNLTLAIDKNDLSQNRVLEPEDIIYIPKKTIANIGYVLRMILDPIQKGRAIEEML